MVLKTVKEFLIPDWRKVLIAVALFHFFPLFLFYSTIFGLSVPGPLDMVFLSWMLVFAYISLAFHMLFGESYLTGVLVFASSLIIVAVLCYSVSCLICLLWDRIRSRNKHDD